MKRNLIWISLLAFAAMTASEPAIAAESEGIFPLMAKKRKKAEPKDSVSESAYKRLTGRDSVALKGVAGIIKKDGSFYLEFPTRLLGREFLVTNRLQRVPSELNEAGVNKGINYENQVVTFEWLKADKKLCIRQQRLTPEVNPDDAMAPSVADNYINPLIASLKIETVAPDSSTVIVKIDDLFNGKQTAINDVFNNINLGTSANSDLSRILDIKAFESNIVGTSELTTIVREGMSKVNVNLPTKALICAVNSSSPSNPSCSTSTPPRPNNCGHTSAKASWTGTLHSKKPDSKMPSEWKNTPTAWLPKATT